MEEAAKGEASRVSSAETERANMKTERRQGSQPVQQCEWLAPVAMYAKRTDGIREKGSVAKRDSDVI